MPYNSRTNKGTPMITKEQILELAKTCKFKEQIDENDEIDDQYWGCWEEQLIEFALKIHKMGYDEGYDEGWESSAVSEYMNSGLVGDPQ
jgi:hypothetical protein